MELFNRLDRSRQDQSAQTSSTSTIHQNTIKEISSYKQDNNLISKMSTCGLDGAVVVWDLNVHHFCFVSGSVMIIYSLYLQF